MFLIRMAVFSVLVLVGGVVMANEEHAGHEQRHHLAGFAGIGP